LSNRVDAIHDQVRTRFARVATDPTRERRFRIGRDSAVELGYDEAELAALPADALEAFAGVGNPLSLAPIQEGMTVLDLGSGSGVDTLLAADRVSPDGRVISVDMTAEMVERTRNACRTRGHAHVDIRHGTAEALELPAGSVDVVITNGVINLCPEKSQLLQMLHRILKPGGRLQFADMSLVEDVNPELLERAGEWSD